MEAMARIRNPDARPRRDIRTIETARMALVTVRTDLGLSQEALCELMGMKQSTYTVIERGVNDVMLNTAQNITKALWTELRKRGIQRSYPDLFAELWLNESAAEVRRIARES
jgi:transcriptional regulator with XRE-family HTH domain